MGVSKEIFFGIAGAACGEPWDRASVSGLESLKLAVGALAVYRHDTLRLVPQCFLRSPFHGYKQLLFLQKFQIPFLMIDTAKKAECGTIGL